MNGQDMVHRLEMAADIIREHDGGDPNTATGWNRDDLLDVWLAVRSCKDRTEELKEAICTALDEVDAWLNGSASKSLRDILTGLEASLIEDDTPIMLAERDVS